MKKLRLFLAFALVFGQLPLTASAAPAAAEGPVELTAQQQAGLYGGACTSCSSNPVVPADPPPPPRKVGSPYWELTSTRQISYSNPGGTLIQQHNNHSNQAVTISYSYTERNAYSWSGGAGIPGGILNASLGSSYDRSVTQTTSALVPARTVFKHFIAHPTTRYEHGFTRWQDWSDGSRQGVGSGSATSTLISTLHGYASSPL